MGYFVAVEGLDGIGKSTVVQHLSKTFSGSCHEHAGRSIE